MQKSLTPRFLTIGVILAWAVYALLPTWEYQQMTEEEKEELRTLGELEKTESRIIRQGLDLKGGMYIVLEADIPLLVSNLASMKDDRLNKIINIIIKKYITDFCKDAFKSQLNIFVSFLVDRPELESGISRFVAERLIQFGQRSIKIIYSIYQSF